MASNSRDDSTKLMASGRQIVFLTEDGLEVVDGAIHEAQRRHRVHDESLNNSHSCTRYASALTSMVQRQYQQMWSPPVRQSSPVVIVARLLDSDFSNDQCRLADGRESVQSIGKIEDCVATNRSDQE